MESNNHTVWYNLFVDHLFFIRLFLERRRKGKNVGQVLRCWLKACTNFRGADLVAFWQGAI